MATLPRTLVGPIVVFAKSGEKKKIYLNKSIRYRTIVLYEQIGPGVHRPLYLFMLGRTFI